MDGRTRQTRRARKRRGIEPAQVLALPEIPKQLAGPPFGYGLEFSFTPGQTDDASLTLSKRRDVLLTHWGIYTPQPFKLTAIKESARGDRSILGAPVHVYTIAHQQMEPVRMPFALYVPGNSTVMFEGIDVANQAYEAFIGLYGIELGGPAARTIQELVNFYE